MAEPPPTTAASTRDNDATMTENNSSVQFRTADAPNDSREQGSSTENQNTSTEDDDASAATATTTHQPIAYEGDEEEYTIKFVFRPQDDQANSQVAKHHYAILQIISKVYPEVKIYDNRGAHLRSKRIESLKSYSAYLRHFDLHYSKGNKNKNRTAIYVVIHRFLSCIPISEIRKHFSVQEKLKSGSAKMTRHMWKEDETRISNLGFFVGFDPSNILPEDMREIVENKIISQTGVRKKKIPKFCCNYSSPILYEKETDDKFVTKAFDLQCRQSDAKELLQLLHATYVEDPDFVFHKSRHTHKQLYINAMMEQNSYLRDCRIIPISGIHPTIMWTLGDKLCQFEGVTRVTKHKDSDLKGRFNVHTSERHFDTLKARFRREIESMVQSEKNLCNLNPPPYEDGGPRIAFKRNVYGDEEEEDSANTSHAGSYATYITAMNSRYARTTDDTDEGPLTSPPISTGPVTQAWTSSVPIQTVVASKTDYSVKSQVSQEEYDRMKSDLTSKVEEVEDRFRAFVEEQRQKQEQEREALMQTIMTAVQQQLATSFQQQMQMPPVQVPYYPAHQQMPSTQAHHQQTAQAIPPHHPGMYHTPQHHMMPPQPMPLQQQQYNPHQLHQQNLNQPTTPIHPQQLLPRETEAPTQANSQEHQMNANNYRQPINTPIRNPNEMGHNSTDPQQPATPNMDVSMVQPNSPLQADGSLANTSMFSHESKS